MKFIYSLNVLAYTYRYFGCLFNTISIVCDQDNVLIQDLNTNLAQELGCACAVSLACICALLLTSFFIIQDKLRFCWVQKRSMYKLVEHT